MSDKEVDICEMYCHPCPQLADLQKRLAEAEGKFSEYLNTLSDLADAIQESEPGQQQYDGAYGQALILLDSEPEQGEAAEARKEGA